MSENKELIEKEKIDRAKSGDIRLLESKDVATIKDDSGDTLLHILASKGIVEAVEHEDAFTVVNNLNRSPLHTLAITGSLEVLNYPEAATLKDDSGYTPLHYLATTGNGKTELFNYPNISNIKDNGGNTPLHNLMMHITEEDINTAPKGIENILTQTTSNSGTTLLHMLAYMRRTFIIENKKLKSKCGNTFNNVNDTPLHILARLNVREILNHTESDKVKNNDNETPAEILNRLYPLQQTRE